jgi:hypothetical protein
MEVRMRAAKYSKHLTRMYLEQLDRFEKLPVSGIVIMGEVGSRGLKAPLRILRITFLATPSIICFRQDAI